MTTAVSVADRPYLWQEEPFDYPRSNGWAHHDVTVLADSRSSWVNPTGADC